MTDETTSTTGTPPEVIAAYLRHIDELTSENRALRSNLERLMPAPSAAMASTGDVAGEVAQLRTDRDFWFKKCRELARMLSEIMEDDAT